MGVDTILLCIFAAIVVFTVALLMHRAAVKENTAATRELNQTSLVLTDAVTTLTELRYQPVNMPLRERGDIGI